ncbi:monovalent cation:proton antiporter family protein [Endozoicomonas sp. GU-1]|uniref:monovalent cation:proton antiporter family protein n=1 Tax=Endozoicomonas sp. GU-1 TaxID=3009078 RepID=UPI0022B2D17E|nr:monovalent cation:proton antiporter family protein [Endozoicomonas sp. GU-1]WBA79433.1 NAD-binding protein [Endozoicomonas sp. GU-1]WBA87077.1 NAD-binding protein [Endozoicomonas sp. GU-1]
MTQENKAYVAIDDDPIHVHEAGLAGDPVFFGDCRKLELLMAVGLERASQVVICIDRPENALKILQAVRQQSPEVPVLVRTRDDSQSDALKKAGATVVIPEVLESSLVIVKHALLMLGMNPIRVRQRVHEARTKGYEILNGFYPGISDYLLENDTKTYRHAVTLGKKCAADQKTIESLDFKGTDVSIVEVRRDNMVLQPQVGMILNAGDIVVLTGSNSDISHIEKLFH